MLMQELLKIVVQFIGFSVLDLRNVIALVPLQAAPHDCEKKLCNQLNGSLCICDCAAWVVLVVWGGGMPAVLGASRKGIVR